MIFTITAIGIFNISSEIKMESLSKHYNEIFEYSKVNAELLLNYKMQVHEYKNKLLMINSMLACSKKGVKKYVEELLNEMKDNRNNSNYWLSELRSIPLPGVRNFINYKLAQLKELGSEIEVFVSSELEKIDTSSFGEKEYNELSTILGVILDNMIESIKETDERLVSINIYVENNTINCDFVNSFSSNIDLDRLNEIGYTTKGEKHGVGLSLVARIVKSSKRFECKPEVMENFFIQHLIINLFDKKNLQKNTKKGLIIPKNK
jgi:two-component system sensor histidine kinase AgrC